MHPVSIVQHFLRKKATSTLPEAVTTWVRTTPGVMSKLRTRVISDLGQIYRKGITDPARMVGELLKRPVPLEDIGTLVDFLRAPLERALDPIGTTEALTLTALRAELQDSTLGLELRAEGEAVSLDVEQPEQTFDADISRALRSLGAQTASAHWAFVGSRGWEEDKRVVYTATAQFPLDLRRILTQVFPVTTMTEWAQEIASE